MVKYSGITDYHHGSQAVTGVLVTNLGTPDAPTAAALRRYLGEFLADPRVVETPRLLWWLILHGVILRIRPPRAARAYAKVWTAEGSPLLVHSRAQADALQARLSALHPGPIRVALGMRYGRPSIESAMQELRDAGARRILLLPLYPQYSATTSASTVDAVAAVLRRWRWLPELRTINEYHLDSGYIHAAADSVRAYWQTQGEPDRLLFSFHGLPRRYLLAGDPYHCQCHATARAIAEDLHLADDRWQLAFQSRFGREEWLKPYTDHTLQDWGRTGVGRVDVVCPGFSADCLETLEEIALQNRELFLAAGGKDYRYIPCLNDSPGHIEALSALIMRHLQGWPGAADYDAAADQDAATAARTRALALGARD